MRSFLFLFFMVAGCASTDLGTTQQAQIEPTGGTWSEYSLWLEDGSLMAEILVMGEREVGAYEAYTEYWTVDTFKLRELGRQSIIITHESGDADPPEPDLGMGDPPGEADPPQPDLQMFTHPVYPEGGWGRGFVGDPFIGGVMMQSADGVGLRLFVDSGEISRVVWYQAIEREARAENVMPDGVFRVSPALSIAEGMLGYAIDLSVQ